MSFDLLPGAIKLLRKRLPLEVARKTNRVADVIHESVIDGTPVDTSKAISNWQLGVGHGPASYIQPHVPGEGGSSEEASKRVSLGKGRAKVKGRKVGTAIHIVNNAPYIDDLDSGKKQASKPSGFVDRSLLEGKLQIKRTVLKPL